MLVEGVPSQSCKEQISVTNQWVVEASKNRFPWADFVLAYLFLKNVLCPSQVILVVTVKNTSRPRLSGNSFRKDTSYISHGRLASRPRGQNGSWSLSIARVWEGAGPLSEAFSPKLQEKVTGKQTDPDLPGTFLILSLKVLFPGNLL